MRRGRSTARSLLAVIAICLLGYLAAIVYLVANETAIVFHADVGPETRRPAAPFEAAAYTRADGVEQPIWLMRTATGADTRPWVLFLHGNGATIASRLDILHYEQLRAMGLNVAAPEYRGYGGTPGVPTESGIEADARSAYDYLRTGLHVPPSGIVVFGWSLGSAVAVDLASKAPEAAVVLEGAPSSLVDIGRLRVPVHPDPAADPQSFESIAKIDRVRAPVLFLHSPEDTVVPIAEGRRLFAAARAPKAFVEVAGGTCMPQSVIRSSSPLPVPGGGRRVCRRRTGGAKGRRISWFTLRRRAPTPCASLTFGLAAADGGTSAAAADAPRVVVVGAGAFGGWTALHLRRRGAAVTLVDAWGPGNARASSGGETRVIRATYGTRAIYTRMAVRAMQLWSEHDATLGSRVLPRRRARSGCSAATTASGAPPPRRSARAGCRSKT